MLNSPSARGKPKEISPEEKEQTADIPPGSIFSPRDYRQHLPIQFPPNTCRALSKPEGKTCFFPPKRRMTLGGNSLVSCAFSRRLRKLKPIFPNLSIQRGFDPPPPNRDTGYKDRTDPNRGESQVPKQRRPLPRIRGSRTSVAQKLLTSLVPS